MSNIKESEKTLRKYVQLFNAGNLSDMQNLFSPDVEIVTENDHSEIYICHTREEATALYATDYKKGYQVSIREIKEAKDKSIHAVMERKRTWQLYPDIFDVTYFFGPDYKFTKHSIHSATVWDQLKKDVTGFLGEKFKFL
eukprot:TRINITY_DN3180_c0_g1_i1.p1 TRINITY_DN3180_c0_g1~~TRINITY_DN3180_c0_g1_i1.p1  ORF type:complete len:140 (-),score=22.24 TRINITY_DN3180_c0_g1_i1:100-519(-)